MCYELIIAVCNELIGVCYENERGMLRADMGMLRVERFKDVYYAF